MERINKNCVFLLSRIPYPPVGGDKVKSYNLLKILARQFRVNLIVITDEKLTDEARMFIKQYTVSYSIYSKPKFLFIWNALKGVFSREPIQVSYYYFKSIHKKVLKDLEESDIVVSNLIRTAKYVLDCPKPKYLDAVDSIGLNYINARKKVESIFWKLIYKIETKRVLEYEKKCIKIFDNTFFVNFHESRFCQRYGQTSWIPNGVNEDLFNYSSNVNNKINTVVFFGKMNYQPNVDAVVWYIKNVHPFLPQNYKFIIVGAWPNRSVLSAAQAYDNIEVTGFVHDPFEILNSTTLVVSPMQTGGGIQNKILESMALGQINVLTTKAALPIHGARDKEHFLICDSPKEIVDTILKIFKDRDKYNFIGLNAQEFIAENYTWQQYEEKLMKMLEV